MSGFLHRLTAHALGQPPEIRPHAVQRWEAGPDDAQEIVAEETSPASTIERREAERAPVATAPAVPDEAFRQPMPAAARPPGAAPEAAIQVASLRRRPSGVAARRPSDELAPITPSARRAEPLVSRGESYVQRGSDASARERRDVPPHAEPARHDGARIVAPDMPAIAMRAPTADAARHPAEGTRHMPDVHIHIGRVELTALTPPAPPRREPAAKRGSLDEYLRRSNRTSS
jgi:hypothetical protein